MIRGPARPGTMEGMQDEGTRNREPDLEGTDGATESDATVGDEEFGAHRATRFGADVRYEGRRDDHEYVAEVRHRTLDTEAVILIDGVRHDPKAEKALAKADRAEDVTTADGLALKLDDGFFRTTITVRRPTASGTMKDREKLVVRTTTLGGAGEVDVVRADELVGAPLVPAEGSPSAAREARKADHPVRFGLIAAGAQAARFLVPLLGLGALLSGLLDPVKRWIGRLVEPVVTWVDEATRGIRTWIGEVTRPVRELVDALLEPIRRFLGWLWNLLFGWIPDIHLGIDVPDWIVDYLVPVLVVVVAFVVTIGTIRDRRERLEKARRGEDPTRPESEDAGDGRAEGRDEDDDPDADGADVDGDRERDVRDDEVRR
ncbi:hypothetical protein Bra3105_08745 [Brachybacterium halotolerans subsp. kimchii]|uniref:hypothetical protein n=1 Tax=Brachybacterium halotolerans TaxID=2795215 RepID=UPI001E5EE6B9|nr:hypothetical protein [Brachybacterium halotolerans]UEJ84376.1 hypothetical protein Bra3105_08745 [Brachybacterium halotolerans subsp. kimchii]